MHLQAEIAPALHDLMLPLPANIRLHLYGHAHIGDAAWAGKDLYRKIACVDNHPIIQCDIASLEDGRGQRDAVDGAGDLRRIGTWGCTFAITRRGGGRSRCCWMASVIFSDSPRAKPQAATTGQESQDRMVTGTRAPDSARSRR